MHTVTGRLAAVNTSPALSVFIYLCCRLHTALRAQVERPRLLQQLQTLNQKLNSSDWILSSSPSFFSCLFSIHSCSFPTQKLPTRQQSGYSEPSALFSCFRLPPHSLSSHVIHQTGVSAWRHHWPITETAPLFLSHLNGRHTVTAFRDNFIDNFRGNIKLQSSSLHSYLNVCTHDNYSYFKCSYIFPRRLSQSQQVGSSHIKLSHIPGFESPTINNLPYMVIIRNNQNQWADKTKKPLLHHFVAMQHQVWQLLHGIGDVTDAQR